MVVDYGGIGGSSNGGTGGVRARGRRQQRRLEFRDDAMFKRVMRDEEICKGVIERIFGWKVERIAFSTTEHEVYGSLDEKAVRMDAYVIEERDGGKTQRVYDIEMQSGSPTDLARRMRAYQSVLDSAYITAGTKYRDLHESYIVFICTGEPFGDLGATAPIYTVRLRADEAPDRPIDCGAHWVAINALAFAEVADEGLARLLEYVATGDPVEGDALLEVIERKVRDYNGDKEWVGMLSTFAMKLDEAYCDGEHQGREAGRAEGVAASVVALVESGAYGVDDAMAALKVPDELRDAVRERVLALTRG